MNVILLPEGVRVSLLFAPCSCNGIENSGAEVS